MNVNKQIESATSTIINYCKSQDDVKTKKDNIRFTLKHLIGTIALDALDTIPREGSDLKSWYWDIIEQIGKS